MALIMKMPRMAPKVIPVSTCLHILWDINLETIAAWEQYFEGQVKGEFVEELQLGARLLQFVGTADYNSWTRTSRGPSYQRIWLRSLRVT